MFEFEQSIWHQYFMNLFADGTLSILHLCQSVCLVVSQSVLLLLSNNFSVINPVIQSWFFDSEWIDTKQRNLTQSYEKCPFTIRKWKSRDSRETPSNTSITWRVQTDLGRFSTRNLTSCWDNLYWPLPLSNSSSGTGTENFYCTCIRKK